METLNRAWPGRARRGKKKKGGSNGNNVRKKGKKENGKSLYDKAGVSSPALKKERGLRF